MQRLEMKLLSRIMIGGNEVWRLRGFSDLTFRGIVAQNPRNLCDCGTLPLIDRERWSRYHMFSTLLVSAQN